MEPGRRSGTFEFQSELARIKLRFSAISDPEVRNLVVSYDLEILPILMKFDKHMKLNSRWTRSTNALARWLDDRIVDFVKTYISLHENQYYLKEHTVEDPIAKVRFPKYAAGAKLEHGGKNTTSSMNPRAVTSSGNWRALPEPKHKRKSGRLREYPAL